MREFVDSWKFPLLMGLLLGSVGIARLAEGKIDDLIIFDLVFGTASSLIAAFRFRAARSAKN